MKPYVIGMDIGGTTSALPLAPRGEEIRHFQKVPREAVLTGESPAKELADFIQDYCAQHGEGATARGSDDWLSRHAGQEPAPCFCRRPIVPGIDGLSAAELGRLAHVPVYFERDVNLLFSCDMLDLGIPSQGPFRLGSTLAQGSAMPFSTMAVPYPARMGFLESWGTFPAAAAGKSAAAETWAAPNALPPAAGCPICGTHIFPALPIGRLFLEQGSSPILQDFLEEIACTVAAELNILDPSTWSWADGVLHMAGFPLEAAERENFSPHPKTLPGTGPADPPLPGRRGKRRAGGCCSGVGAGSGKEGGATRTLERTAQRGATIRNLPFWLRPRLPGGECEKGIVCCGTGVGISIAANKVKGIRCVCCSEPYSALLSRQHNNTNMLAMGSRVVGKDLALMIVDQWLQGKYEGGRHQIRLDEIQALEETGEIAKKIISYGNQDPQAPLQRAVKKPAFDHGQRQVFSLLPLRLNKKVCGLPF